MSIRRAAVANLFYPGNAHMLKQVVLECLGKAEKTKLPGRLKAIIAPHAGYQYSGEVAGTAYKLIKELDQDTQWKVLLLGPSHNVPFAGAAVSGESFWETPLGKVPVKDVREGLKDEGFGNEGFGNGGKFRTEMERRDLGQERVEGESLANLIVDMPEAHQDEHSLEVQVPFLQVCLKDFVLYPLCLGSVRPDFLGEVLKNFVSREDVIVVASSDLSHFLSYEKAREVDLATSEAICSLDIEKMAEIGDACGRMGVLTVMSLAEELGWKCKMLQYLNSGDTAGEMSRVVGYGAYAFYG